MPTLDVAFELPLDTPGLPASRQPLTVELPQQALTVADLIAHAVTTQLTLARLAAAPACEHLDEAQIERQRSRGRVALQRPPEADLQREIARARQAFVDGHYRMLLDGQWLSELDEPVALSDTGKLLFLRLMPLKGG